MCQHVHHHGEPLLPRHRPAPFQVRGLQIVSLFSEMPYIPYSPSCTLVVGLMPIPEFYSTLCRGTTAQMTDRPIKTVQAI